MICMICICNGLVKIAQHLEYLILSVEKNFWWKFPHFQDWHWYNYEKIFETTSQCPFWYCLQMKLENKSVWMKWIVFVFFNFRTFLKSLIKMNIVIEDVASLNVLISARRWAYLLLDYIAYWQTHTNVA